MTREKLIEKFEQDLKTQLQLMIKEASYRPKYLEQMIVRKGGYRAAKDLISKPGNSYGFLKLLEANRRDLTIEALVVREEYHEIFSAEEIIRCEDSLKV